MIGFGEHTGCAGVAASDDQATGRLYLLEANPPIAKKEDFADSAEHFGMAYEELLQKIITLGLSYGARP